MVRLGTGLMFLFFLGLTSVSGDASSGSTTASNLVGTLTVKQADTHRQGTSENLRLKQVLLGKRCSFQEKCAIVEPNCTPTTPDLRDGIDNDCDGLIDEEVCVTYVTKNASYYYPDGFIPDFDLDNRTDEDCGVNITFIQSCECPCFIIRPAPSPNITKEEKRELIEENIKEIKKDLQVDKDNITAVIAKKISAKDERTSSVGMGILAISLLVLTFGGILLLDVTSLIHDFKLLVSNIKG
ncbi:hypothetical protein ScPMuIL_010353 [Solemya velum]